MKELLLNIYKKYKKYVILIGTGLALVIIGLLSWKLVFVKYKIFYQEEKAFLNGAKRYYEYHAKYLPRKGESRDLTLQQLYDLEMVEDLYIPNTRKTCDVNESFVRVINEDGEYRYVRYLKCGRYSSRVDHTGPEITLKGGNEVAVAFNGEYKELGVAEVYDKKDKQIDVKKVTIDSSKVNPKEVGTYEVTYTVKDSNFNETIAVRKVSVVRGLTDTVKSATGDDNIYKGNSNNYVLFSGMLWRIVSADNNGNVRLILNEGVTSLRFNHEKYEGSNIDTWLKNVFYKALNGKDHLVKTKYCVGNINSMNDYSNYCSVSVNRYVGLLDVNEYYKSFSNGASSVFAKNFALGHVIGDSYAEANYVGDAPGGVTRAVLTPIRPVITLKNDMKIMSGNGTISDPFKLDDYEYAAKKDKINTRIIGEYLEYSGIKFRIIGFDKDKNVRLIMDSQWEVQPAGSVLYIGTEDIEKWVFNPKEDNNTAYILNTDCLDYINTKYIVDTEYEVPTNDPNLIYSKYKTKKVKGKIMLPKTYELFASAGHSDYMYVYIDTSTNNSLVFATNAVNGRVFELHVHDYQTYGVKAVITIKGDLKIESGNGTADSPYKLK